MPGAPSLSPAAVGRGVSPGSIGQSLATGMASGQPAAAGAQSLSEGAMSAIQSGSAPAPLAMAAGIESAAKHGPVDAPSNTPNSPPASTASSVPVAPAVLTAGPVSAPAAAAGGPAVPAGPLPAYGSDLRPPVVAAPATAPATAAPVSGAPVASSAASSASAGGAVVSPVERAAAKAAAGQAGAGSASMVGAWAVSATAGASAGAVSAGVAEQQRLQRMVDAVARQEPRLWWAAGLREDGITSLLVTDLAGGWIPPHVRLPANVTLLEPTARRRDAGVVDLLGAVVVAAAHEPHAYVAEPGADAPGLTGDRSARSAVPKVDELGPTLVEAVRRRDGLPRIAQVIVVPAVRKTGVPDNEAELLRDRIAAIQESVLNAYPRHNLTAVGGPPIPHLPTACPGGGRSGASGKPVSGDTICHVTAPASSPMPRPRSWPAIVVAAIAAVVAVGALIVALINSTSPAPSAATTTPTYTAAETAAAQRQLCDMYKLAAQAVQIDTAGSDKALARIATTNGAVMLEMAAANPALDASDRDAARALAKTYMTLTAKGSYGVATDAEYQAALDDLIGKDAAMKKVCGGG